MKMNFCEILSDGRKIESEEVNVGGWVDIKTKMK